MATTLVKHHDTPPFADHKDLHNVIDATQLGDVVPPWMDKEFEVWYRDPHAMAHNILANPTYKDKIDYVPFYFMSGDWAWQQAVHPPSLSDPETHGSALIPIILSSDKTTVSVGTGNNEYYPLYASIADKMHSKDDLFWIFCHQLFHSLLSAILSSLKPVMTEYEVVRCGDRHFWCVIYSLGPYIADYEEQLVLSCIVKHWCPKCIAVHTNLDGDATYHTHKFTDFLINELHADVLWDEFGLIGDLIPFTNDFPRADIHELLLFDLLHQLIKGAFKDHLIDWVAKYLKAMHRTKWSEEIMSNIDCRVAAVPSFSGHDFKQWTGNDSKALMKVFLPAIEGHIPQDMVCAFCALLEFCYLVRHNHSMVHYVDMIRLFGAPNGLCSSITESKHIKAIKEPWRWSNRHNALGQMLVTNQRLDKLAASHADFDVRGMLTGTILSKRKCAQTVAALAHEVAYFLFSQLNLDDAHNPEDIPAASLPRHEGKLQVFNSAAATFYAPSDLSDIGGMQRKHICACPLWRNEYPRNDCVFINTDSDAEGMQGLKVARVICFFSFKHNWEVYPCALIQWFEKIGDCPDEDTGMWMVTPSFHEDGSRNLAVIHIEMVFCAAHLIAIYGSEYIPHSLKFYHSLDTFGSFYVNKYADHHAFEIVS
ncbi:uncharacterized protein BJ212DRAFT_1448759 [Suillus subaureus]|uniref:Uncharacterized protein n=1 Tax=Suillus subaureus TaxID=48587 RepID=A0A9P7J977_9AGAM|nr:uncharacterized protein BJ212DRAFT_1448759 [Suillus subaureus]KAG1809306.1 hypothetical protein BJ212DRAFT_1448759 [Suillus subaureus]